MAYVPMATNHVCVGKCFFPGLSSLVTRRNSSCKFGRIRLKWKSENDHQGVTWLEIEMDVREKPIVEKVNILPR